MPAPPDRLTRPALFLDMDGVLAPFAPRPDDVVPTARRTAVLKSLAERFDGRVAVISGRTLSEIDRITGDGVQAASGVHGLERRLSDGTLKTARAAPEIRTVVAAFDAFAEQHAGVIVEDKGVSAGLHYRQNAALEGPAVDLAHRLQAETGLNLQPGDMVLELKTPGASKGTALTAFMGEAPFAGAVPIMLGDDLTDEHGFEAAAALGGFGVLVGAPRETAARFGLSGVDAVLDWLERITEDA
ncbi:MAG: trehalose-phosphatase [Brevundimonas sp.]|nr:MAG: trehalose-phosphatase [Brevundimonas sp.]